MNSDPAAGEPETRQSRPPLPRARPVAAPVEEELETGEPIPDDEGPAPPAKKIPAIRGRFEARPVGRSEPREADRSCSTNGPNNSGGGQMLLATAKYLRTPPEEPASHRRNKHSCQDAAQDERSIEGRLLNAGVGGGILAMGVAFIWFVVGLMNDVFFFYPPILFVIGLIAFFKGLAGGEK